MMVPLRYYVRYVLNGEDLFMAKLMRAYLMDLEAYHEIHLDLMEKYDVRIHNLTKNFLNGKIVPEKPTCHHKPIKVGNTGNTVCKFQVFSVIQNLREINFGG